MLSAERIGAQSGPVPPAWRVIGEWYYICTNDCKMHISHHHLSNLSITNRTARFRCTCHSLYHGKIQMTSHTQVYRSGKVTLQFDRHLLRFPHDSNACFWFYHKSPHQDGISALQKQPHFQHTTPHQSSPSQLRSSFYPGDRDTCTFIYDFN